MEKISGKRGGGGEGVRPFMAEDSTWFPIEQVLTARIDWQKGLKAPDIAERDDIS
jgi:hypothetical protein